MHSNPGLLPLQRSTSTEDYRYGNIKINKFLISRVYICFKDYFTGARGRPSSTNGLPSGYDIPSNPNHLMNSLQTTSAGYNSMVGGPSGPYGHPYGSTHPPPPSSMHGLSPAHLQSQQQNPHMISVQNGPVILVSNLNEDVS